MSKRPDTYSTLLVALELLKRIPPHKWVSAPELHQQLPDHLPRDLRTVQRQLDMLAQSFDIERNESGKPYGYRWKQRAPALMIPTLSEQESLLLMLAEQHLRNLLPASLMQSLGGFFEQAQRRLDPLTRSAPRERAWLGKVRVIRETQPLLAPRIEPGVFETVSNALYDDHWLTLDYRNAAGKKSRIHVMPLGLAQQGPRLYLVCRFDGFDNERTLALHRIEKAEKGNSFQRPKDFDLKRYDDDGRFGFGEGKKIRLVFRIEKFAGAHLLESPLSSDQQVKELAEVYEISATVVESEQLTWWLRGFGEAVSRVRKKAAEPELMDRKNS